MHRTTVTSQGRITIPAAIRRMYGIGPGTRIVFERKDASLEIRPITPAYIDSLKGMLKAEPDKKPVTQELIEEHRAEVASEE